MTMETETCLRCKSKNVKIGWADDGKGHSGEYYECKDCHCVWDDDMDETDI